VWQHTYASIVAIKKLGSKESFKDQYLNYMRENNHPIPALLDEYLRCIGNIKDPSGVEFMIKFPAWPNRNGHFGRVSDQSHNLYETLAAPFVTSQAIIEDLRYTLHPEMQRNWDLPTDLRPEKRNAGLPSKNLLRWSPVSVLSTEQRRFIESAGIEEGNFNPDLRQFMLNKQLFEKIADLVQRAEERIKIRPSVHESAKGNTGQMQWQSRDIYTEQQFSRATPNTERQIRQNNSRIEHTRFTIGALTCGFIVQKDEINDTRIYACYDFNDHTLCLITRLI
jgi:hypothetical protein